MKIIKWWLLIPMALIIIGFIGAEVNKAYWDARVRELCERDGGVVVYEKVFFSYEEYNRYKWNGSSIVIPFYDSKETVDSDYFRKRSRTILNKWSPEVWKTETIVFKKNDNSILGRRVTFGRRGGDFSIGVSHPSSYGCNDIKGFKGDLNNEIFIHKGEI